VFPVTGVEFDEFFSHVKKSISDIGANSYRDREPGSESRITDFTIYESRILRVTGFVHPLGNHIPLEVVSAKSIGTVQRL
jgi:hypothetical protein